MTRYKQYLREKGFKLECDFPILPHNGIETIRPWICGNTIRVTVCNNKIGTYGYVIFNDGEILGVDPN